MVPYLRLHRLLTTDTLDGIKLNARDLGAAARKLDAGTANIQAAATTLERAQDLSSARTAFAAVSNAILAAMKASPQGVPAGLKVAYCPMMDAHWLQRGDAIQNPFYGKSMPTCGRFVDEIPSLK